MSTSRTVLGFDYGSRHIGVAIGFLDTKLVEPLTTIEGLKDPTRAIASLLKHHHPSELVVGSSEQESAKRASLFASTLRNTFHLPVTVIDETLSTHEAQERLRHRTQQKRRLQQHAAAAAVILERRFEDFVEGL